MWVSTNFFRNTLTARNKIIGLHLVNTLGPGISNVRDEQIFAWQIPNFLQRMEGSHLLGLQAPKLGSRRQTGADNPGESEFHLFTKSVSAGLQCNMAKIAELDWCSSLLLILGY